MKNFKNKVTIGDSSKVTQQHHKSSVLKYTKKVLFDIKPKKNIFFLIPNPK